MQDLLKSRIRQISSSDEAGACVLYVMSRDQRVQDNHALVAAQKHAQAKQLPLAVVFNLYGSSGYRAREHYEFMLAGLKQVEVDLNAKNIPFVFLVGNPHETLGKLFNNVKPDAVYFDFNPLRGPRHLQQRLADEHEINMFFVDTHNVVPVWVASDKKEIGARTLRPRIHKNFSTYLEAPDDIVEHPYDWPESTNFQSITSQTKKVDELLVSLQSNGSKVAIPSGEKAAHQRLEQFVADELENYGELRNDPSHDAQSDLSPYLHFGQLASLRVALKMHELAESSGVELHLLNSPKMPQAENASVKKVGSADALLEEMIVRKELSDNFCYYQPNYDSVKSADEWAKKSIAEHDTDQREHAYSFEELVQAKTHDPAWNAAQRQMMQTGKMHGYMRMYWAKKVLEWSPSRPHGLGALADFSDNSELDGITNTAAHTKLSEEIHNSTQTERSKLLSTYFSQFYGAEWAIEVLNYLNDFYSIDGGDPNGYAGILWSICGVHDRPWTEREVFGKIRYMNYAGLKRKFNIDLYEKQASDCC